MGELCRGDGCADVGIHNRVIIVGSELTERCPDFPALCDVGTGVELQNKEI